VLINATGTMFVAPLGGHLVDRIGPRRMALITLPLLAVAVALIGATGPAIWTWYAGWAVLSVVQACAGSIVYTKAVVSRFDQNRGLALGIMLSGSALAHGVLPAFAVLIMSIWDWRAIYFILGAATALIGWPLAWGFFHGAGEESGADRRRTKTPASRQTPLAISQNGLLLAAIKRPEFWRLALSFFMVASAVAALYVHFLPVLIDAGFSSQNAAAVAVVLGPAALLGRLGAGYFLDRFQPHRVVAIAMVLPAISYSILLIGGTSSAAAGTAAALMGIVLGAEADFMAYLVSRYFGQQTFGSLYGLMLGIFAVGYGVGPVLTGEIYDATRSYVLSLYLFSAATISGALLIARLGSVDRSATATR
jgi:predicted MFS family arabinose efflux permease